MGKTANCQVAVAAYEIVSHMGKAPTVARPKKPGIRVDQYCKELKQRDWKKLNVRNTAKGKLKGWYHFRRVWVENNVRGTASKRAKRF